MNILINDSSHPIKVIHSRRARCLRISISPDKEISLIIPRRSSKEQGIKFLNSKIGWVEKTLKKMKPRVKPKWKFKFEEGSEIFFFGLPHRLHFSNDRMYPYTSKIRNSKLEIGNKKTKIENMIITIPKKKIFINYLSNKLREHIYSFAYKFCQENGFKFKELKIKNIVSRWGSCSAKGNINFSIRLVHFDKEVINYVVVHELCHTKEMNHSKKFWALVEKYCPKYKTYIKMLK